jgi:2-hydroxy-6-oxonona-2,4-dienedioate hydrolase
MASIRREKISVLGRPAVVHAGGTGEAVVLVHGGWAGAASHWERVWGTIADGFRVIAPELPGIGDLSQPGLGTIAAYARWLEGLLDAVGIRSAALVGNSFGAAAVWALAARARTRCGALVLVDGVPMPRSGRIMKALGRFRLSRATMRRVFLRSAFSPRARARAFAYPERLPHGLSRIFEDPAPPQLDALLDVLVHGGDGSCPAATPLLVWGERDRLPGSDAQAARRLHAALPGARLAFVPDAGHLPQLENPGAFLAALLPFLDERLAASAPAPA